MNGKRWDHDLALNRWAQGWKAREIAVEQGMSPQAKSLHVILQAARKRGDRRAVRRNRSAEH